MAPLDREPPSGAWVDVAAVAEVAPRVVRPVEAAGEDLVLWRAARGELCALERRCPHLQSDLAEEGVVDGDELVCAAHFWRIDRRGQVSKRNVRGRTDPKGTVAVWACREADGRILVAPPEG